MKTSPTYNIYLLCLLAAILLGVAGGMVPAHADETITADAGAIITPDPMALINADSAALFHLINSARENPLAMAESLGLKRDQILVDLPDLKDILLSGLPPLVFNARLYQTAGDHTRDMLANNYYAYESIDGRTLDDRMNDAGYVALRSGESLGMMAFGNFMAADKAVFQMFTKMLKDELNPEFEGERRILNTAFKDLGVSVQGGVFKFDRFSANAYMATCDFGASVETYELQLLNLINQARNNPRAIAELNGADVKLFLTDFPEFADTFAYGLPPVRFNASLYLSAEEKINDMLENEYFGKTSPTGITLDQRMSAAGYGDAEWAGESLSLISTAGADISPLLTVPSLFNQMFFSDLRTDEYGKVSLLSEKAMDTGCRIQAAASMILSGDHLHLGVGDFGAPLINPMIKTDPVITGVVFTDENSNNLYDTGEEITNAAVTIWWAEGASAPSWTVITNAAGGYALSVAPGLYRVSIGEGESLQFNWVRMETVNAWQVFKLIPEIPVVSGQ